jgi:uncharacterized membrane protein YvlD (DUF360 family)
MPNSLQHRRKIGRQYLRAYGWFTVVVNCVLFLLMAKRYYTGALVGSAVYRYAAGMVTCFVLSIVLILVAKSE